MKIRKSQFDKQVSAYGATWERHYRESDNSYTIMVDAPDGYAWSEGYTSVIIVIYFPDFGDTVSQAYAEAIDRMQYGLTPDDRDSDNN